MGDVDMLLENNIILDKQIYDLWLQGYSGEYNNLAIKLTLYLSLR